MNVFENWIVKVNILMDSVGFSFTDVFTVVTAMATTIIAYLTYKTNKGQKEISADQLKQAEVQNTLFDKQIKYSYLPTIVFDRKFKGLLSFDGDRIISKSFPMWTFNETTTKDSQYFRLINIGNGIAKNVNVEYYFNHDSLIKYIDGLENVTNIKYEFIEENDKVVLKIHDFELYKCHKGMEKHVIGNIFKEDEILIPICESYFGFLVIIQRIAENSKFSTVENIPILKCKVVYTDQENDQYSINYNANINLKPLSREIDVIWIEE
jgi:hypothetical protein